MPVLDRAFAVPAAGPGAGEAETAARLLDHLHQPRALAGAVRLQAGGQVTGPVLDLPTVRFGSRWSWSSVAAGQVAGKT
jgi:hypothetical protein